MVKPSLVLLGDSILDNAPYTRPAPDTTAHLQRMLPDWSVSRFAQDGAVMADVPAQLRQHPARPTVTVLSVGGNDVVEHIDVLDRPVSSSAEILADLLAIAEEFDTRYEAVVRSVAAHTERTILCTIYEVPLEPAFLAQLARVPLALVNDRIVRIAARFGLDALDLRSVCTEQSDFVLQIEPSAHGAAKIAGAIAQLLDPARRIGHARLFAPDGNGETLRTV